MNTKLNTIIETASRHLVCALAALVAGSIALSMAAGPVEAKSTTLPLKAPISSKIIIVL